MPPPQALIHEDLVAAAALDRDALLLVEVGLQAVECPAAEGQAQVLRGGQRRGDDLGPLLGGVGRRPAGAGAFLQPGEALLVEAADPGIGGRAGATERRGDGGGGSALGSRLDDPGALDEADRGGAGAEQLSDGLLLLGGHRTEGDSGGHGTPPGRCLHPTANHLPDAPLSKSTELF
jgi:hypothetical protein